MENKLKWNESGIQKAGKRFAYPFTGPLDGKRYLHRGVSSSTTVRPLKRTNAAFFINWKGNGSRLSIAIVPSDSRLLKIQDPSEVCTGPPVGRVSGKGFFCEVMHFGSALPSQASESRLTQ
jgi:hypothetical protein